jgi:TetR/AcrR family acrAB operon transcriptional repressor
MGRKTKQEAAITREGILDAAVACFHESGVAATTLATIATRAGYTRGAVYWHFKNKAEVIAAVTARKRVSFVQRLEQASDSRHGNPLASLRAAMAVTFHEVASDPRERDLLEVMMRHDLSNESAAIRELQRELEREEMQVFMRTLSRAAQLGHLREGVDLAGAVRLLWLSMAGAMYGAMVAPHLFDIERDGMASVDAVLAWIAAPEAVQRH